MTKVAERRERKRREGREKEKRGRSRVRVSESRRQRASKDYIEQVEEKEEAKGHEKG